MAKQFPQLEEAHQKFIEDQHMFFVGTAGAEGRVNISPKGMDSLRVLGPNRIVWMNLTGSGNETAGHLLQINRMTLMWCSFTTRPMILRTYGTARCLHVGDDGWDDLAGLFPNHRSARQIYDQSIDMVQTSCGYAVPFMEFQSDRDTMQNWVDGKSDEDIRSYWVERNSQTIDGKPTGVPK
ncbi:MULTISPECIES: pyridoxamine 5'-phosphate oxidase family protein [Ruegeria]|uniref:Pyridoxamine 5'-phosphate oxidase family protein n=1 Tax=Ruegeria atlantica TaxID=81569 RepID=A0ABX1W4K5_9RHOB|nr:MULTISPECIES: pyridoxamine 5'-phosphate oxidase family protein [Ruegeria]NOC84016.1 pyridoxamine 5'-phosphate oxidase family protein [Ruegeria sp. HKCCD6428]NOD28857.1 pyridoxamine 5'-phosphate oxidase family protein [Ruegeria atlantica]NOD98450.1 pyridoxamine 5'-phosphate oxidase family protein [Ruegeria sp. HKCCD6228]QFT73578.1 Pyridoxamine 5'-phosphate oxidase [Ruegeria sp. THAF33]